MSTLGEVTRDGINDFVKDGWCTKVDIYKTIIRVFLLLGKIYLGVVIV